MINKNLKPLKKLWMIFSGDVKYSAAKMLPLPDHLHVTMRQKRV